MFMFLAWLLFQECWLVSSFSYCVFSQIQGVVLTDRQTDRQTDRHAYSVIPGDMSFNQRIHK